MGEPEIIQPEIVCELSRIPVVGSVVELTFEGESHSSSYMIVEDKSQKEIDKYNSDINLRGLTGHITYILKDSPLATALLKSGKEGDTITFKGPSQENTITIHRIYFPERK
jgi:transcription elongation GreA/GreB family factor